MKQLTRKTLGAVLALVMVLTLLPAITVTARADGPISLGNVPITTPSDLETPLTLEARTDGTITISGPKAGMQYSLNGGPKTDVTTAAITVSVGDKAAFYGTAASYYGTRFLNGAECYIYGNIMSLVDAEGFATAAALTQNNAFRELFGSNRSLFSHDSKKLVLPAATLANSCYANMFYGCTNLNAVTCLATDISADNATDSWLDSVAAAGTFTKAPAMTGWTLNNVSGIPEGWTVKDYTTPVTYLDETGAEKTCEDYTVVKAGTDPVTWGEAGATTWYAVKENATIDNTVTFYGDVRLILCDDATLTVNSATEDGNAIKNSGSGSLIIYAQSADENAGELQATAQKGSAILTDGCAVTVNGGKVTATMGSDNVMNNAGIEVKNGSLTINGGVVNASVTGYYSGIRAEKAPVTINGGSVTAEGNLAGINLNSTYMTMNGGSLAANSGNFYGIGSYNGSLTVTGGTVTAESRSSGINVDTVSISGGDLTINNGISGKNVSISGGDVKVGGSYAIYGNETVTISGGAVEATGRTYGIRAWNGDVTITGGDVTASATNAENASAVGSKNGAVVIGPGLRVDVGDNESAAVKVTKTFPASHDQKWAHIYEITQSTYTLTIPAAVTVSGAGWNATGGVGASGELAKGQKLTVTAASGDDFALVCQGKGQIGYYLAATATDTQAAASWTFTALDDDPATQPMGVIVSETDYSSARPGTYTDTVTFTAQVEDDTIRLSDPDD